MGLIPEVSRSLQRASLGAEHSSYLEAVFSWDQPPPASHLLAFPSGQSPEMGVQQCRLDSSHNTIKARVSQCQGPRLRCGQVLRGHTSRSPKSSTWIKLSLKREPRDQLNWDTSVLLALSICSAVHDLTLRSEEGRFSYSHFRDEYSETERSRYLCGHTAKEDASPALEPGLEPFGCLSPVLELSKALSFPGLAPEEG